jgi:hypothetical protein
LKSSSGPILPIGGVAAPTVPIRIGGRFDMDPVNPFLAFIRAFFRLLLFLLGLAGGGPAA